MDERDDGARIVVFPDAQVLKAAHSFGVGEGLAQTLVDTHCFLGPESGEESAAH